MSGIKLGVVGRGNLGGMVINHATRLTRYRTSVVVSVDIKDPDYATSMPMIRQCDVIILAVPIRAFKGALCQILEAAKPDALIIDVCTVKEYPIGLLKEHASDRNWIACHPNFGPQAFSANGDSLHGLPITVCAHNFVGGQLTIGGVIKFLEELGLKVTQMSAAEHDKLSARSLFVAHHIVQILLDAGIDSTSIDTPSFTLLLRVVAMLKADGKLFADVLEFNNYCAEIRLLLHRAEQNVYAGLTRKAA